MTDYEFGDDYAYEEEPRQKADGPKALRDALKTQQDENKNLAAELAKLKARERERTVAGVLSEKGISPKVAKLIPSSVDADESAVEDWLKEYSDVFGIKSDSGADGAAEASTVPAEDQEAMSRMNSAATSGTPPESRFQETMDALKNADPDKVLEMVNAARMGRAA